eukprot:4178344-Amphidinium_carterae.2
MLPAKLLRVCSIAHTLKGGLTTCLRLTSHGLGDALKLSGCDLINDVWAPVGAGIGLASQAKAQEVQSYLLLSTEGLAVRSQSGAQSPAQHTTRLAGRCAAGRQRPA